jgi:signal transduction histidine kinase
MVGTMGKAFDRVLLARHFALSVGAAAAYLFRTELAVGYMVLWIVGVSATLNFLAYAFSSRPGMARICEEASPVIGIGGWGALVFVTNGIASPFIAGLWLEIVLSAMSLELARILWVALAAIGVLWVQQLWLGVGGHVVAIVLQSGFMAGMGLATFLVTRRWTGRQASMEQESQRLGERLGSLTQELEEERTVAAVGENVARLAHGLKNTVHSLRGFVSLIEPRLKDERADRDALGGLQTAIDDLERLARLTLNPDLEIGEAESVERRKQALEGGSQDHAVADLAAAVPDAVRKAVAELTSSHPRVSWDVRTDGASPSLTIPESSFSETLVILMRNAVEAMQGEGRGLIELQKTSGELILAIGDEGPGIGGVDLEDIFKPGFTTKAKGSGYGLFLARRIVEEHGGTIAVESRPGGGALFQIKLPVLNDGGRSKAG